jgi:hypothetical protein
MKLCIVTYTFEHGRRFCQAQGLNFKRAELVSTDANYFLPRGLHLADDDAVIKYGPYYEGRNAHNILHFLDASIEGNPFEHIAYDYNEPIPWPDHILTTFGVSRERR